MRFLTALSALAAALPSLAASAPEYSLTVYSSAQPGQIDTQRLAQYGGQLPGYALVRDQRQMRLAAGQSELRFSDVAARMDPTTVSFTSLTDPAGTRVIEQNYQFDLVSGEKLLERFLGEEIAVEQQRGDSLETVRGRLLSAQGGLTLQSENGELHTLTSWNGIRFPSLPGGLITRPTLVWTVNAGRAGEHDVQVAYQASGLTWWADYNATLDEAGGCSLDLSAWVTLVNQSGGSFPNAQLKLVAGEVNRAPAAAPAPMMVKAQAMRVGEAASDGFSESSLFEYHLYTLGRRTDLPDNSTKQLALFPAVNRIACRKELVFTASPRTGYWGSPIMGQGYAATSQGEVGAFLAFDNRKEQGLGVPLPAGRVRVNQRNGVDGSLEFIGEDVIGHTPKNEKLNIKLGKAFDIVGERKQTEFRVDSKARWMEETFEITVRNRKDVAAEVVVREYLYRWSSWSLTQQSQPHSKRDAQTIDFVLKLPADGERKVSYQVRYSW